MASFFSCTATIFLTISTFSINGCNAYGALIEGICKQSQDYKYCMSVVGNDPRAASADLHRLALLSIQVMAIQIQDTLDQISRIHPNLKDPLSQRRLRQCKSDYDEAYTNLESSFSSTSKTAYMDAINFMGIATNKVIDCHNGFRRNGPIATSPIDADDMKVFKLSEIFLLAVDRLIPKKL
ncbi:cell wall/vacuolar inhibitor of fructosidase 2 [Gossypium australe]|uniref:Cell wall/vacuolar inhibitor of fructosidase 2 n=1 Tax=Gossypium australe TaxID=47621 RepID=A0A5B6W4L6_9ROSI|nr:cell wall/vacuolar inhibitor of fructosidase 2 [Gossypium australe]